jgi:hypothetical protein
VFRRDVRRIGRDWMRNDGGGRIELKGGLLDGF